MQRSNLQEETQHQLTGLSIGQRAKLLKYEIKQYAILACKKISGVEIEINIVQKTGNGRGRFVTVPNGIKHGVEDGQEALHMWVTKKELAEATRKPDQYNPATKFLELVPEDAEILVSIFGAKQPTAEEAKPQ